MNIKLDDIRLSYSYKTVLDGVTLKLSSGKIHALLGENGAGKSSLVKILTGAVHPTSGKIFLDDEEVHFKNPRDSLRRGIACVYQRPFLADNLTVRENLRIGIKNQNGKLHSVFGASSSRKSKIARFYVCGTEIMLDKKSGALSGAERFFAAFSSALLRNPKVLILDEPTAFLSEKQSESLFVRLRSLSDSGVNVIVITHNERDLKYCDDKTFVENGKINIKLNIKYDILNMKKETFSKENSSQAGDSTENNSLISNISHLTSSTSPHLSSEMILKYRGMGNVGIIPSDRTFLASNPNLTIAQVLYPAVKKSLEKQSRYENFWGDEKNEKKIMLEIIKKAGINIRPEEKAFNLSGGMLQRLILERELWNNPETIVLDNPYQGLDNASCRHLKERLDELSKNEVYIIE